MKRDILYFRLLLTTGKELDPAPRGSTNKKYTYTQFSTYSLLCFTNSPGRLIKGSIITMQQQMYARVNVLKQVWCCLSPEVTGPCSAIKKTGHYKCMKIMDMYRPLVYLTTWLYIPSGVSTSTALYSSAGVAATCMASICSKLPKGWHLGISSEMGRWWRVPVISRIMLSIM